jgi:hypothetical protein
MLTPTVSSTSTPNPKFYDAFGQELFVGDTVVLARPGTRFLRKAKLEKLELVKADNKLEWTATVESEEYTADVRTADAWDPFSGTKPTYSKKTVQFRYTQTKFYKNLSYVLKHGVKFRRFMKINENQEST